MKTAYLVIIITFLNFSYLIAAENEYVIKENNYGITCLQIVKYEEAAM